ncbi:efflux transporter outer membrane subunit [Pseudomonas sp. MSSRFD41]|uniref:efflux transporter outer membrane subunit n=1 Tax=unclassified Pseudomonas TaxID=196821 RepID=UPI001639A467|nr:efflux transporter outer membrane subunit [Pseudomonas sp. MSSRFD41]MBC2658171.1 efflux transporter outer membrane subunit [Pseudomonas sp. MSSRFD41]
MTRIHHQHPALVALLLALAGCSLAPEHQRPGLPVAEQWPQSPEQVSPGQARHQGYRAFITDPHLLKVVETALGNNRSLRQTLLDIEAARAQYRIQRSERLPSLNADASAHRAHVPADLSSSGKEGVASSYKVGLSLPEYELDLFGRLNSLSDSALEHFLAAQETAASARIALIAETIQGYLNLEGAQRQRLLTHQTLLARQASLNLVRQQLANGTATALDFQEARGLVEHARADLENSERLLRQARNALVLLVGTQDAAKLLPTRPGEQRRILQQLSPGAPSQLLEQRPDILASEHVLRARNADIGAARAAFFPRITLTGSFGSSSTEMSRLFDGGSRAWTFIPNLELPLFHGGRNRANLDLAKVRKDSAVASYEQTVQTAFREVADALDATDTLHREVQARNELAGASGEALVLAKARYERGVDNHLRYLEAQRSHFNDQLGLIRISTEQQLALVALYRALGGAWY